MSVEVGICPSAAHNSSPVRCGEEPKYNTRKIVNGKLCAGDHRHSSQGPCAENNEHKSKWPDATTNRIVPNGYLSLFGGHCKIVHNIQPFVFGGPRPSSLYIMSGLCVCDLISFFMLMSAAWATQYGWTAVDRAYILVTNIHFRHWSVKINAEEINYRSRTAERADFSTVLE